MLRTLALAAIAAATLVVAPTAQAAPGCAGYIKVCARPGPAATGGGGERPFFSVVRDPVTHQPVINPATGKPVKKCSAGCDHL